MRKSVKAWFCRVFGHGREFWHIAWERQTVFGPSQLFAECYCTDCGKWLKGVWVTRLSPKQRTV